MCCCHYHGCCYNALVNCTTVTTCTSRLPVKFPFLVPQVLAVRSLLPSSASTCETSMNPKKAGMRALLLLSLPKSSPWGVLRCSFFLECYFRGGPSGLKITAITASWPPNSQISTYDCSGSTRGVQIVWRPVDVDEPPGEEPLSGCLTRSRGLLELATREYE